MAQIAEPRRSAGLPRPADRRTVLVVEPTLVAIALAVSDPGRIAWVRTFFVIFGALLIQALPFVMIGATAAALVEVFVPIGTLERLDRSLGPCSRQPRRSPASRSRSASAAPYRSRAG